MSVDGILVGCENRAPSIKPTVHDCSNSAVTHILCESSYYAPKFVAMITSGNDSTSAMIEPKTVYNTKQPIEDKDKVVSSSINLAGFNFDSFVTDATSVKKPFSGSHSPNPGSLFGTYLNDIFPVKDVKKDLSANPNAIYLTGLEYINDRYYIGGTQACLENRDLEKCPKNTKNCVLAKLINSDTVKCKDFTEKLTKLSGMIGRCTKDQINSCSVKDSFPAISGGTIPIRQCSSTPDVYCYENPVDLCQISNAPKDRSYPGPDVGDILNDTKYYNVDSSVNLSTYSTTCTPVNDVVNCVDFLKKLTDKYPNTYRCTAEQATRCSVVADTVPAISGGTGASIRLCNSGIHCYISPTNKDLCKELNCTSNRTVSGYDFDGNKFALRDKTSYEMSLCVALPQPKCAATSNYTSQDDGYAAWPETQVGQKATGKCKDGGVSLAPLERWCVPNPDNKTFNFSPLYTKDASGNKVYSNVKCQRGDLCEANDKNCVKKFLSQCRGGNKCNALVAGKCNLDSKNNNLKACTWKEITDAYSIMNEECKVNDSSCALSLYDKCYTLYVYPLDNKKYGICLSNVTRKCAIQKNSIVNSAACSWNEVKP